MNEQFANLNATRALLKSVTSDLTVEQLNKIPKGFNNNIAWNLGHILVTQQLLVYALTDTKPLISENLIQTFRKGTAPEKEFQRKFWTKSCQAWPLRDPGWQRIIKTGFSETSRNTLPVMESSCTMWRKPLFLITCTKPCTLDISWP